MSGIRHQAVAPTAVRVLAPGDDVDRHRHDDHQLIYASAGVLEVTAADGTWFTPPTRAVWVPGGVAHDWRVHGNTTVHLVGIPAALASASTAGPMLVSVHPLQRELLIECSSRGAAITAPAKRMLRVLVDETHPSSEPATMLPALRDERLQAVQRIVEADLTRNLSLGELGRLVGASERTLSRLFREGAGMSFTLWRTQIRLRQASLLLAERRSVTQVAIACGFSSSSAFISTFRAAFGRTPGSMFQAERP